MHFDDPSCDREPKARAALGLGDRAVHLLELIEDLCLVRLGDAGAGVADRERIDIFVGRHLDRDLAPIGELDRVADQVEENLREPALVGGRVLLERLQREIDSAFGKSRPEFASQFEYEVSRLQARRAAPKYVDWLVRQSSAAPMEIIEVESVNRLHAGGYDFVGFIDRVDRPVGGGAVTIFDYKTGRVPEDPRAYLEAVRTGDEAQLALYYFMRRARGDEVARVALVSIRDIHDDVRVLALDIVEDGADVPPRRSGAAACTRAVLDASLAALVRRCDLLTKEGLEHFEVGEDPPCRFCAYLAACRERPPESESIFVR